MEIFSKVPLKNALKFGKMITRLMDFFVGATKTDNKVLLNIVLLGAHPTFEVSENSYSLYKKMLQHGKT